MWLWHDMIWYDMMWCDYEYDMIWNEPKTEPNLLGDCGNDSPHLEQYRTFMLRSSWDDIYPQINHQIKVKLIFMDFVPWNPLEFGWFWGGALGNRTKGPVRSGRCKFAARSNRPGAEFSGEETMGFDQHGASWGFSCNISLPRMTKVGAWPGSNRTANGHFPIPMSGGLLRTASTGSSGFQNAGWTHVPSQPC